MSVHLYKDTLHFLYLLNELKSTFNFLPITFRIKKNIWCDGKVILSPTSNFFKDGVSFLNELIWTVANIYLRNTSMTKKKSFIFFYLFFRNNENESLNSYCSFLVSDIKNNRFSQIFPLSFLFSQRRKSNLCFRTQCCCH